jgi:integrase
LISVATAAGLRVGEAVGLRWADVNFTRHTLRVHQALERSGGDRAERQRLLTERRAIRAQLAAAPKRTTERKVLREQLEALRKQGRVVRTQLRVTEPKSARSRRTIYMPSVVETALQRHRTRQRRERLAAGRYWEDTGLAFTTPIGTALDPRNATREFHALCETARVPKIRFHDLRHTAATLLLVQGVDPRTIMETLGHSQISLTMNTYSHVLPALQEEAAARMDAILSGGKS